MLELCLRKIGWLKRFRLMGLMGLERTKMSSARRVVRSITMK